MLRQGDQVKYHRNDNDLNRAGFVLGETYTIETLQGLKGLMVHTDSMIVILVENGLYTDNANHFTLVRNETLPRGLMLTDYYKVTNDKAWPEES